MVSIVVTSRTGEERGLSDAGGRSVMEVLRDNGVDEIVALCGGRCSCATCHVYVDPAFASLLPPITEAESDLLDSSDHRDGRSRLSCQIQLTPELDGLRVTIAPED